MCCVCLCLCMFVRVKVSVYVHWCSCIQRPEVRVVCLPPSLTLWILRLNLPLSLKLTGSTTLPGWLALGMPSLTQDLWDDKQSAGLMAFVSVLNSGPCASVGRTAPSPPYFEQCVATKCIDLHIPMCVCKFMDESIHSFRSKRLVWTNSQLCLQVIGDGVFGHLLQEVLLHFGLGR